MTQYMISFDEGAMDHISEAELPAVADAAHGVIREAKDAGVFVFTGGFRVHDEVSVVAPDGTVTDGPFPEGKEYLGGLLVVDVPSRAQALRWAAKVAAVCRCAQQVRAFGDDPDL